MIHRITNDIFKLELDKFILSFVDGTSCHWLFFEKFLSIHTKKIYFITCSWINRPGFLTLDQLRNMINYNDVEIGAHSFEHEDLNNFTLDQKIVHLENDTAKVCNWFSTNIGYVPKSFAYPNNHAQYGVYTAILQKYGFQNFYGSERIDPLNLTDPGWLKYNKLW